MFIGHNKLFGGVASLAGDQLAVGRRIHAKIQQIKQNKNN